MEYKGSHQLEAFLKPVPQTTNILEKTLFLMSIKLKFLMVIVLSYWVVRRCYAQNCFLK